MICTKYKAFSRAQKADLQQHAKPADSRRPEINMQNDVYGFPIPSRLPLAFRPFFPRSRAQCPSSNICNPIISNPPAIISRMGGGGAASIKDGVLAMPALRRHSTGQSRFSACLAEGVEIYCVSRPPMCVLGLPIARLQARPGGVSPAMGRL